MERVKGNKVQLTSGSGERDEWREREMSGEKDVWREMSGEREMSRERER